MTRRQLMLAGVAAGALLLAGCSEQERREIRAQEERIAAEAARQQRLAMQYATDVAAETKRLADQLQAETDRLFNEDLTAVLQVVSILVVSCGLLAFVVYSFRRLGEFVSGERTKRHDMTLKALVSDPHLSPQQREKVYLRLAEAANRGGTPLLGYGGDA